jgi:hypothetical protein
MTSLISRGETPTWLYGEDEPLRYIALAAFGQEPPTYRTACFGIAVPPHDGSEAIIDYRALGAPQIFALHPDKIHRWEIVAQGDFYHDTTE